MKKNLILIAFLSFAFSNIICAQNNNLILEGDIEFEKKVNTYAFIERDLRRFESSTMRDQMEKYKAIHPQFITINSKLKFSKNLSLYTPITTSVEGSENKWNGNPIAVQNNIIWNDLSNSVSVSQRIVSGNIYLVKDSLIKIKWKITDETREIAGYNCRRANGIVLDSIYVVAFFTNKIPVESGPELFSGLPGMILGVALPYENVTWFAKKITERKPTATELLAPNNGKLITNRQLLSTLEIAIRNKFLRLPQIFF